MNKTSLLLTVTFLALFQPSCAGKSKPLDRFESEQSAKITTTSVYDQAEFVFKASLYEPSMSDLEQFKQAWVEHGQAFPDSRAIKEIEAELSKNDQKTALVVLFMTAYENADLRDKEKGWTIHPVPEKIVELSEVDMVLRRFMPIDNPWARYFLVRYKPVANLEAATELVVSNPVASAVFKRK